MAGKPKRMSQIKQLLQLHQQGKGRKTIAKLLGISKNTVKTYLARIERGELDIEELLKTEDPVLEGKLFAGNPSYKDLKYDDLKQNLDYYSRELKRTGVTRRLLWDEYRQVTPNGYGYTQFCFHLNQHMVAQKPSMVLTHQPGEKLFIDFAGKKLSYIDKDTGEVIECQVFIACLPYSDYSFAMVVRSQGIEDFIYALSCCLKEIGGVPQTLVPDNLKSAVIKADKYEPDVNNVLEDFANHYGTTVTPARARKPKDKALVENQVQLIYGRVYAKIRNHFFFDIHSLNQAVREKVRDHNQTRMQQKDYCREERFLSDEKKRLKPLPTDEFEIKHYRGLKVAKNNHVYFSAEKHYYSVPYAYIGQKVKVVYTRAMVHIYAKGHQIAVHPGTIKKGVTAHKKTICVPHTNITLTVAPNIILAWQKTGQNSFTCW